MKALFAWTMLSVAALSAGAQQDTVYSAVAQLPEFPGGAAALMKYLANHIAVPAGEKEETLQTRIQVDFVVTKEGKITDPVIREAKGSLLEQRLKELLLNMPLWKPGRQAGKPVAVKYSLPVVLEFQE